MRLLSSGEGVDTRIVSLIGSGDASQPERKGDWDLKKKHIVSHWNNRDAEETVARVVVMPPGRGNKGPGGGGKVVTME